MSELFLLFPFKCLFIRKSIKVGPNVLLQKDINKPYLKGKFSCATFFSQKYCTLQCCYFISLIMYHIVQRTTGVLDGNAK